MIRRMKKRKMKKKSIHITKKEARSGCERILSLPGQETRLRVPIAPGTKDGQKIKVNNAVFRDENGDTRRSPLQVTVYVGHHRYIIIALTCVFVLLFCGQMLLVGVTYNSLTTQSDVYQNSLLRWAEYVYRIEPYFMLCLSIALSIIFWAVPRPDKLISPITYLILSIVAFLLAFAGYIQLVKENYTYTPNIYPYKESLQIVESKIKMAGLEISDIDFNEIAENKKNEGKDAYGYDFKVYQTDPLPNTFVRMGTNVRLKVTWNGMPTAISVPDRGDGDAELPDIYIDTDTRFIYTYNADMFTLSTDAAGVKMTIENFGEMTLGISRTDRVPIEARLIDYNTGKQIDSKKAILGDEITFSNIPNGTYYYVVSCNGYKTAIPDSPFKLERDYNKEEDILPWNVYLEREDGQLSTAFKVRIQNANGNIIQDSGIDIRPVSKDNPSPNAYTHYPLYSDENGYLTFCQGINSEVSYELVDFQLYEGCYLEARLNESNKYVRVQIKVGIGICTIPD